MTTQVDVAIIGAGFSGLVAAIELKRAGRHSFVILERASSIGGVWRDNIYPGCACDVRSHLYSIARHPSVDWSGNYARQPEILAYLENVVDRDGLRSHVRLGWPVIDVCFDEQARCWRISGPGGDGMTARAIIIATGPHSRPQLPAIEGLDCFEGTMCHSAEWRKDLSLAGRRVAVIGTGASAIQIVPAIAPEVERLSVFQRSAPWIMPRGDRSIGGLERAIYRYLPGALAARRAAIYWLHELVGIGFVGSASIRRVLTAIARIKLAREVTDRRLREQLTPHDELGCKRVLVSDDYYPSFGRDNVRLVTSHITRIEPRGIRTEDGEFHPLDHLIFATGFNVANPDGYLSVTGRNRQKLADQWAKSGPQAFLGITVSGFPNLAILLGPNSGLSHSSAIHVVESQMNYVMQYLDAIAAGSGALEVDADIQRAYNMDIQEQLKTTVWASGCTSWYIDRNGRNTTIFPGITSSYRRRVSRFNPADYVVV